MLFRSAQGYLVAASGIAMSSAMIGSGVLYARYGDGAYYAMAAMALAGACLIVSARKQLAAPAAGPVQPQSVASGG